MSNHFGCPSKSPGNRLICWSKTQSYCGLIVILFCCGLATRCRSNEFCLLADNRVALQARVDMILNAQSEISLAYYAIDTGNVPLGLLELLRQAASRGIRVRILADGLKSRLPADLEELLQRDGVCIRLFHPPLEARPLWLNRRLHDKLLLVDRRAMVIGSRNLQDQHFGMKEKEEENYVDCDAYLVGAICEHAAAYFDWLWKSADVLPAKETQSIRIELTENRRLKVPFGLTLNPRRERAYRSALKTAVQHLVCTTGIDLEGHHQQRFECVSNVNACLIRDLEISKSDREVQRQIVVMIDSAQTSLLIESPYPIFTADVFQALRRAAERGVHVRLFTSSLETTDQILVYAAHQNHKSRLLRTGICVNEYVGMGKLHTKTMVVDNLSVLLGSYNFDERSDHLNLELCVRIDDPHVAALIAQSISSRLYQSQAIAGEGLFPDVGGAENIRKRAQMRLMQTTIPIIRRSL